MERMTVEQRDGQLIGVVQSPRAGTWRTVLTLPETVSASPCATISHTARIAREVGCAFVEPAERLSLDPPAGWVGGH